MDSGSNPISSNGQPDNVQAEYPKGIKAALIQEAKDVLKALNKLDFSGILSGGLDRGRAPKIQELRGLPLIVGVLTEERVRDSRNSIVQGVMSHKRAVR